MGLRLQGDKATGPNSVQTTKPKLLILSPMCRYFSTMMNLSKLQMAPGEFDRKFAHAVEHLRFAFELIDLQIAGGRWFLFEHPAGASSWLLDFVRAVVERPDSHLVLAHQCRF